MNSRATMAFDKVEALAMFLKRFFFIHASNNFLSHRISNH